MNKQLNPIIFILKRSSTASSAVESSPLPIIKTSRLVCTMLTDKTKHLINSGRYENKSSSKNNNNVLYTQRLNESSKTLNWLIQPNREKEDRINEFSNSTGEQRPFHKGHYYHEKIVLGYSRVQMCNLVYNVAEYKEFVPFCINSEVVLDNNESDATSSKLASSRFNLNLINKAKMLKKQERDQLREKNQQLQQNSSTSASSRSIINTSKVQQSFKARLEIGYPPIQESYVSYVTMIKPELVKAISRDTSLFEYLINEWKFHPHDKLANLNKNDAATTLNEYGNSGGRADETSCIVEFYVAFKFRSSLYSTLSGLLIDQIFKQMVTAFTKRAQKLYGPPSIPSTKLS